MIVRLSAIVQAVSGSIGGATFVRTKTGTVVRPRSLPTRRTSALAAANKAKMFSARLRWRELTDAQRRSWRAAALTVKTFNRLGEKRSLSGFQLFIQHAMFLSSIEIATLGTLLSYTRSVPYRVTPSSFTQGGPYTVNLTPLHTPPGSTALIYGHRPFSSVTPKFFNNPKFILRHTEIPPTFGVDVQPEWDARFGALVTGEVYGVALRHRTAGQLVSKITFITGTVV